MYGRALLPLCPLRRAYSTYVRLMPLSARRWLAWLVKEKFIAGKEWGPL